MSYMNQVLSLIKQGGAISYVLTILYMIVMVISVERAIYFITRRCNFRYVKNLLRDAIEKKDISIFQNDKKIQKHKKAHNIHIVNYYIKHQSIDKKAFNEAIEREAFILLNHTERYIWILSQVGSIAPLLGLLGTVIGLIEAFQIMSTLGAEADVASFAGGIWVAMITTANGLIVAIPSFLIYRVFERIIEKRSNQITVLVSMLNQYFSNELENIEQTQTTSQSITSANEISDQGEIHEGV